MPINGFESRYLLKLKGHPHEILSFYPFFMKTAFEQTVTMIHFW
jgi:hypothetical protein